MQTVTEKPTPKAISEGYKRTEVGVIPEDWKLKKFNELIYDLKGGASLSQKNYTDNGIKVIPKGGVTWGGKLQIHKIKQKYCSKAYANKNRSNCVDNNYTIIVLRDLVPTGPNIGLMVEIDKDEEYILAQGVYGFKVIEEEAIPKFLIHLSNSRAYRKLMGSILVGSTQVHIRTSTLKETKIPLPPTLKEQQAIAEALSDVDALIAELDALIEKKQQIKKGAMQQLLTPNCSGQAGKKRLPGFDGEWEDKKLGDIASIVMGSSPSSDNYNDDGYGLPLIGGNADIKNRKSINRIWTTQIPKKCNAGDVIMTVRAPVGAIALASTESCLGRGVCALQVESLDKSFLFYQMMFNESEWESLEQGSTFTSANSKQIEEFSIPVPQNKEEQKAIASILSDMDAEIQALQAKRAKYQQIKQGMMQELLTGKTRLVNKQEKQNETEQKSGHNWQIDEAVLISVLADRFGSKEYPIGRFRRTKLSYLVRRFLASNVDQFLKKAAGPYNHNTRYSGPEKIALDNGYVQEWENGKYSGFIADENIAEAQEYFEGWHGLDVLDWLDKGFRFKKNDDLELLTTVDKSIVELREEDKEVSLENVKDVIASHPEWEEKLERDLFSDENIEGAIEESLELFR